MSATYRAEARSVRAGAYHRPVVVEWSAEVEAPTVEAATAEALDMFRAEVGARREDEPKLHRTRAGGWVTHTNVLAPRRRRPWLLAVKAVA